MLSQTVIVLTAEDLEGKLGIPVYIVLSLTRLVPEPTTYRSQKWTVHHRSTTHYLVGCLIYSLPAA